jgi:hypothetical protein
VNILENLMEYSGVDEVRHKAIMGSRAVMVHRAIGETED